MKYLVVGHREEYTDVRRGCVVGGSPAEFSCETFESLEGVAREVARLETFEDYDGPCSFDTILAYRILEDEDEYNWTAVYARARVLTKDILDNRKEKQLEADKANRLESKKKTEDRERAELRKLREKYNE
jgi:hypothetical protein